MLSRLIARGQGVENEGWRDIVARRQTNAEQMFNYQHSVLRSLKISASKCRCFMGTYASTESWSCNTVPTFPWTASPGLAPFASAVGGAPIGLELAGEGHQERCAIVGMKLTTSSQSQRYGPPSILLHPIVQGHAGVQQLLPMPSWEPDQAQGQAGKLSSPYILTS